MMVNDKQCRTSDFKVVRQMATWKFEYIVNTVDVHDLFWEAELRWVRVDRCEEGGCRRFVVTKDSADYLGTAIRAAMLVIESVCPGLTLELLDVHCDSDSYASFLITAREKEC